MGAELDKWLSSIKMPIMFEVNNYVRVKSVQNVDKSFSLNVKI